MFWTTATSVFFGMVLADIMWAIYFISMAKNRKWISSLASGIIILISSKITVEYVHDQTLIWFAATGAIIGTLMVMYFEEHKEKIISFLKNKFGKSDDSCVVFTDDIEERPDCTEQPSVEDAPTVT